MTEDDLKAIEQRVNADPMKHLTLDTECAMEEVIAHARQDVPALIAEVRRLRLGPGAS